MLQPDKPPFTVIHLKTLLYTVQGNLEIYTKNMLSWKRQYVVHSPQFQSLPTRSSLQHVLTIAKHRVWMKPCSQGETRLMWRISSDFWQRCSVSRRGKVDSSSWHCTAIICAALSGKTSEKWSKAHFNTRKKVIVSSCAQRNNWSTISTLISPMWKSLRIYHL